jgi:hypothetical protein
LHDPNEGINLIDKYAREKNFKIPEGLKEAVGSIGLHLTDLGFLLKKIHSGTEPDGN